jgi:hypothetical protein
MALRVTIFLLSPSHLATPMQYTNKGKKFHKISKKFKILKIYRKFKIQNFPKKINIFQNLKKKFL